MIAFALAAALFQEPPGPALSVPAPRVLVFSKTAAFRHDSIPTGVQALKEIGEERGFTIEHTEDGGVFSPGKLGKFDVVLFLSTTGDVLDAVQEAAFESFVRGGGGYVGIHAAADTEYDWPFYADVVGAHFKTHPKIQKARVRVEDRSHPATHFLPADFERTDEWYTYRSNPREKVHVLMSLDESTYEGGGMGDHPITWWKTTDKGRCFYTGFGHTKESYAEPDFRRMLGEAIVWAAQGRRSDPAPFVEWPPLQGWTSLADGGTEGPAFENVPGANRHLTSSSRHGDGLYHLEFRIPKGSNSGVYLMGRYELQILDSSGVAAKDMRFSDCGGIYERWGPGGGFEGRAPLFNAFAGPGRWNSYDILFRAPRFANGKKTENARFLEVRLNGIVIHRNVEQTGPTRGAMSEEEAPTGPILLQGDHGPVAFRNIWVQPKKL
jgi:type 1 glutamine amidotransferase